jgi:hypothetical protein
MGEPDERRKAAMDFMEIPHRKRRGTLLRHAMIVSAAILALVAFRVADDEITGKAEVSDAFGFTTLFLLAGYYIGWLPEIWEKCRGTAFESLIMPIFMMLVLAYLYFSFRSHFIQPGATGASVCLQLFVMICLMCRIE